MMNLIRRIVLVLTVVGLLGIFAGVFLMPFIIAGSMWWAQENPPGEPPHREPLVSPADMARQLGYAHEIREPDEFPLEVVRERWREAEGSQTVEDAERLFAGYARKQVVWDETRSDQIFPRVFYYYPVEPDGVILVATFSPEDVLIEVAKAHRTQLVPEVEWEEAE